MGHNTPTRWFKDFLENLRTSQQEEQTAQGIPSSKQKLFPMIRFHDLRHLHATLLIGEGIDIYTVSRRLGHARTSTTADIYCHPLKANDIKAASVIESILFN
jgi:integrase